MGVKLADSRWDARTDMETERNEFDQLFQIQVIAITMQALLSGYYFK